MTPVYLHDVGLHLGSEPGTCSVAARFRRDGLPDRSHNGALTGERHILSPVSETLPRPDLIGWGALREPIGGPTRHPGMQGDDERRRRFERLVAEVEDPLTRYLRRRASAADADDVMGDVLLTLWRRLDAVPNPTALPWCYGVARRALANHRRGERRRLELVKRLEAQPPVQVDPDGADQYPHLAAALAALPDPDREVLALWAWEGLEPREIAIVLETTPNAISLRLLRAKKKLARELARQKTRSGGHMGSGDTGEPRT